MEKRIKSVLPIYLMGAVFAIYALIFPMHNWRFLIALVLAIVAYFIFSKLIPDKVVIIPMEEQKPTKTGIPEADAMLNTGKQYIKRLKGLDALIQNVEISSQINSLVKISEQIFGFISKNPEKYRKLNTFMDYYYPTALKLLESYVEFDKKVVKGDNIRASIAKISDSISKIRIAFEHQLDNLYSDKALDIKTDISVLENIIEKEGLS